MFPEVSTVQDCLLELESTGGVGASVKWSDFTLANQTMDLIQYHIITLAGITSDQAKHHASAHEQLMFF